MKSVSIIIPTLNEERNIKNCLNAIFFQNYPKNLLEVLILDGGSDDKTIEIAKKMGAKVIHNPGKTEEKGRMLGFNKAKGEIIGTIDADNVLPNDDKWLTKIIKPFDNKEISASDTTHMSYRPEDNIITRYFALVGGDDPIASYLGINDRYCYFTDKLIGTPHKEKDCGEYVEVTLDKDKVPAAGSNAFFFRKKIFKEINPKIYNHTIFAYEMVKRGYNKISKVKTSIIHVQPGDISTYFRKHRRRVKRRANGELNFEYNYGLTKKDIMKSVLYISTIILPLRDTIRGFHKKPTLTWIFHPIATFGLLFIYGAYWLMGAKV
jgi:glycosyltransferase involved in cell wall biosynthesis